MVPSVAIASSPLTLRSKAAAGCVLSRGKGEVVLGNSTRLQALCALPYMHKKFSDRLKDTGQPLVLIYNPYENRYELMTRAYLQQSPDLSVLVASPVTAGGDG